MATIQCPYCRDAADIDDGFHCSHCGKNESGEVAAKDYVEDVMEVSRHQTVEEGGDWPIDHCDECGSDAFVYLGPQVDPDGGRAGLCFQCGYEIHYAALGEPGGAAKCWKCGKLFDANDGITVCPDCFGQALAKG